jgi:radical SAM superfamily enzyme YgiQ (UPF0313 family)
LRERTYPGRPPIYYLSGALRAAGYRVKTLDVDIVGRRRFLSALRTFQPHIVAGSSLSIQIDDTLILFRATKAHSRDILTVLGGNHATAAAQYLYPLHASYLDVVVAGEGITAILKIAALVERNEWHSKRGDVPGAVFCDGATLTRGAPSSSELPDSYNPDFPYHPSYDFDIFARPDGTRRRTFQVMTAASAPQGVHRPAGAREKGGESRPARASQRCGKSPLGNVSSSVWRDSKRVTPLSLA